MCTRILFFAALTGAIAASALPAAAFGPGGFVRDFASTAVISYTSSVPSLPRQQGIRAVKPATMTLDAFRAGQLKRINASYNRSGAALSDGDLAVAKRDRLVAMGFPAKALGIETLGVSVQLVARTQHGVLVLDRGRGIVALEALVTASLAD